MYLFTSRFLTEKPDFFQHKSEKEQTISNDYKQLKESQSINHSSLDI